MRFGDHIVMFNLGRIPMIGNLNNGFTIIGVRLNQPHPSRR